MEIQKKPTSVVKKTAKGRNQRAPLSVTVQTARGGFLTMKQITPREIKALRNPAYKYLA